MRADLAATTERVIRLRARLAGVAAAGAPLREIEDALCDGYAQALAGDGWATRAERRLRELIDDESRPIPTRELRALGIERAAVLRAIAELRRELAELRGAFECARAASRRASA